VMLHEGEVVAEAVLEKEAVRLRKIVGAMKRLSVWSLGAGRVFCQCEVEMSGSLQDRDVRSAVVSQERRVRAGALAGWLAFPHSLPLGAAAVRECA
jgi:hypothetical protein